MASHSQPTILYVDGHDAVVRDAVAQILERSNFRVKEAHSGAEALRMAFEEQPDLVLLDINLPDISGLEVCRKLKSEPATAQIPVLQVAGSSSNTAEMARGLEGGADSYLVEPVEPELLIATIHSLLRARRAEAKAYSMAREWQATFDAISDGVALLDAQARIQRCNENLARLYGRPASELTGQDCRGLWGNCPQERQPFARSLKSRRREAIDLEHGSRRLSITVDPIFDEQGKAAGAVLIARDVTEKILLEEQFRESQKFETIGTLAAGVAHDFNNLLTSVMGNASLLLNELGGAPEQNEKLEDIIRAAERAANLTHQLLAYSGKGRHYLQKVELSRLVQGMEDLIEASIPKKVKLTLHLAPRLPRIEADTNQIQQVVLNLVSNAAEAIGEESGSITIRTGLDTDGLVYLEVQDTGCGMDAETKARIFDPFFTTKFTGRGLGLAAVAGIVRGHKASLHVTSAPGQGSTFRISFAAAEEIAPAIKDTIRELRAAGTVLVVDDEEMVRRIATAALEVRGYRVLIATNGAEAIQMVREHPEINLVLLDLTMPVMSGEEAIDGISSARPGIPVIVSTGYDRAEAVSRFNRKGVAGYLQKPYSSRQLADKVKSVLGSGAAGG